MDLIKTPFMADMYTTHTPTSGNMGTVFFKPHIFHHKTQTLLNASVVFNKCLTGI